MLTNKEKWFLHKKKLPNFYTKENMIKLFSIVEHDKIDLSHFKNKNIDSIFTSEVNEFDVSTYKTYTDGEFIYGVIETGFVVLQKDKEPVIDIYEEFHLDINDLENVNKPINSTYGRVIANYVLLVEPFKNKMEYKDDIFDVFKLEKEIAKLLQFDKVTLDEVDIFLNNLFFLANFSSLIIPVFTEKSLVTDPSIKDKKKELMEKYKDQLHDPVILSKIEDELIKLDKDWLKNDDSMGFFGTSSKKFNVHRKKQFVVGGIIKKFGTDDYTFIENSLSDGWDVSDFIDIVNESRGGSYSRGKETANGGVQTKTLLRLFQSIVINQDDCRTTRTLKVHLTKDIIDQYLGRTMLNDQNDYIVLTEDNKNLYLDKHVNFRSLMYCEASNNGFCFTCAGEIFRNMDLSKLGVLGLEIGTTFLMQAMKQMHGTKLSIVDISDLDKYIL